MKAPKSIAPMIDTGIDAKDRAKIAAGLSKLLADTFTVYLKTHNFHWNVTGPMFNTLHDMFMQQYTELWTSIDLLAERIRALGHYAPGSYAQFGKLSSIGDVPTDPRLNTYIVVSSFLPVDGRYRRRKTQFSAMHLVMVDDIGPKVAESAIALPFTRWLAAMDAVPTLKGGSTIGIPSPPAILLPDGRVVTPDIRWYIEHEEWWRRVKSGAYREFYRTQYGSV